jgi:hypothetical protein
VVATSPGIVTVQSEGEAATPFEVGGDQDEIDLSVEERDDGGLVFHMAGLEWDLFGSAFSEEAEANTILVTEDQELDLEVLQELLGRPAPPSQIPTVQPSAVTSIGSGSPMDILTGPVSAPSLHSPGLSQEDPPEDVVATDPSPEEVVVEDPLSQPLQDAGTPPAANRGLNFVSGGRGMGSFRFSKQ